MENEIKIIPPDGYDIDMENSTFECIKFKPTKLDYIDVSNALFAGKWIYYIDENGYPRKMELSEEDFTANSNNCVSEKQTDKLMALNRLINVAKYLNGDWKPDFSSRNETKWFIIIHSNHLYTNQIEVHSELNINFGAPCFKSQKLAEQAIEILGEETIKLALSQV